jgi:hypothetical protein
MTKDYANKNLHPTPTARAHYGTTAATPKPRWPSWLWLGIGLILGCLLSIGLGQQLGRFPWQIPDPALSLSADFPNPNPTPSTIESEPERKPRFDFYTLLPNLDLEVPDVATPPPVLSQPSPSIKSAVKPPAMAYIIQTGSFKQQSQAEQLKAMLALAGLEPHIQVVKINASETWYRVYIGPFDHQHEAKSQQDSLQKSLSVNSLVLKIRV